MREVAEKAKHSQQIDYVPLLPHVAAEVATKTDPREMEQRLILKLAGMIIVTVGLVATVVKLIH